MKINVMGKKNTDITEFVGGINLNSSIGTLGQSLAFTIPRNPRDSKLDISDEIETGDVVILSNEKELFRGVIVNINTSKFSRTIECLDYCFYLNKNKTIKQFEELSASSCILQLLQEINAPVGQIPQLSTSISKLYNKNTFAEIIVDILKQVEKETGIEYKLEYIDNVFNVSPFKKIKINFQLRYTGGESLSESILDMKNRVLVLSNEQDSEEVLAVGEDVGNIEKYGCLQEIVNVEPDKDISQVRNIAKTTLKKLNRVSKKITLEAIGNDEFRAGRVIEIENSLFKLKGEYLINSCTHTWKKGEHIVNLEVQEYEE